MPPSSHIFECQRCGREAETIAKLRDGCRNRDNWGGCAEPATAFGHDGFHAENGGIDTNLE